MRKVLLLIIFFLGFIDGAAQEPSVISPSRFDYKNLRAADRLMNMKSYYNAIDKYKLFYEQYPDHTEVQYKLGKAYCITRDYKNAVEILSDYTKNQKLKKEPAAFYYLGYSLKSLGRYEEANTAFGIYTKQKDKSADAKTRLAMAQNEAGAFNWVQGQLSEDSLDLHFSRLLGNMNRAYSDFSPYPVHHDTIVFASMASDSIITFTNHEAVSNTVKLYETTRGDTGKWTEPKELRAFNHDFLHTANGVQSPDGKYFYFTRCYADRDNDMVCNIYYVEKHPLTEAYSNPREVKGVNMAGYTSTQPTFQMSIRPGKANKKDTTIFMYFVSNRPKSKGMDIWYAQMQHPGLYKDPKNCGNIINTIGDELTPYYDHSSNKLYFSSNFHYGFGGQDIFKSEGSTNRWTKPQNLKIPINSSYDDTYFIPVSKKNFTEEAGYLVSNRPGGIALHSETCCDDIYYYKGEDRALIRLKGDVVYGSKEVMKNPKVDSLRKLYVDQLKSLANIDSSLTADNFKTYYKRNFKYSDSTLINKARQKRLLLKSDTSMFSKVDTVFSFKPVGKTKVGVVKKNVYQKLALTGDTNMASLQEHIVWLDTTDETSQFNIPIKKNKGHVLVFHSEGFKPKIRNVRTDKDTTLRVQLEDQKVGKDTAKPIATNKSFADNIEAVAKSSEKETVLVLDNLYFDFDSDIIKETSMPVMQLLWDVLLKYPNMKMDFMGHTDSRGTEEHNQDLSQRRSEAVRDWLIAKGIDEKRLTGTGYGESKPVLPNENTDGSDNPENRAKNRRTEVKIIK